MGLPLLLLRSVGGKKLYEQGRQPSIIDIHTVMEKWAAAAPAFLQCQSSLLLTGNIICLGATFWVKAQREDCEGNPCSSFKRKFSGSDSGSSGSNKVLISFSFLLPLKQKNLYNKKLEDYLSTSTMENFPKSKQKGEVEQRRRIFNVKSNFPSKKIFMSLVN